MGANDPRGWPIRPPGARMAGFMLGTTNHRYILNLLALGLMVSDKKIFECSLAEELNINI